MPTDVDRSARVCEAMTTAFISPITCSLSSEICDEQRVILSVQVNKVQFGGKIGFFLKSGTSLP